MTQSIKSIQVEVQSMADFKASLLSTKVVNNVDLDTVRGFTANGLGHVSGSYLQTEKHAVVSERFQVIQPAAIGAALALKGFELVSSMTGKAKHEDKRDFQTTTTRYRSKDLFQIEGLNLDIIHRSKHLGRGQDEIRIGFFRGACANQWAMGQLFNILKFRHTGDALDNVSQGLDGLIMQRDQLVKSIELMQNTPVSVPMALELAKRFAALRLEGMDNVLEVDFKRLLKVRRSDDQKTDLFTVSNVVQENITRIGLGYTVKSIDAVGRTSVRSMTTRAIPDNSGRLVDLTGTMFDAAMQFVA